MTTKIAQSASPQLWGSNGCTVLYAGILKLRKGLLRFRSSRPRKAKFAGIMWFWLPVWSTFSFPWCVLGVREQHGRLHYSDVLHRHAGSPRSRLRSAVRRRGLPVSSTPTRRRSVDREGRTCRAAGCRRVQAQSGSLARSRRPGSRNRRRVRDDATCRHCVSWTPLQSTSVTYARYQRILSLR